jgi:hypothetical protein
MQVMAVLAVPRIEVRNWVQQDWGSVKWGAFLNVMFWCARQPRLLARSVPALDSVTHYDYRALVHCCCIQQSFAGIAVQFT